MIAWILLGVGVVLIALTALYVAAEFSLVTVDRALVDQAAADGDAAAKGVRTALRNLSTQLSGAQVGITVTTLALGYVMEPSLASLLHPLLTGLGLPSGVATGISVALALALATVRDYPAMPVLLMTGYADQRERAHGLEQIIHDVIAKPFTLAQLQGAVDGALATRRNA